MKYIKLFEHSKYDLFWKIPSKSPEFFIAMKKIGVEEEDFERWFNKISNDADHLQYSPDYVFMFYSSSFERWTYGDYSRSNLNDFRKTNNYQGTIKISKKEIDEWELEQNAKKYNL